MVCMMSRAIRVILVEDNESLLDELLFQLHLQGFAVRGAPNAHALDALLAEEWADVLVIDVNLPGENGFSIARRLRNPDRLGIIFLTARDAVEDKLHGLDGGADLYLVKPIDRRELAASIKALYRRLPAANEDPASGWRLHPGARVVTSPDGRTLELSALEFRVFEWLCLAGGRTRSRRELFQLLGIEGLISSDSRVNTCISRLRKKLSDFDPALSIIAWRNQGYAYVGPPIAHGAGAADGA